MEAGVSRPGHGLVTGVSRGGHGEESPAMTRAGSGFSEKSAKNTSRGAEAPASAKNPIVAVAKPNGAGKPNGHAVAKRAGVK